MAAILETMEIPYTHSGVRASAIAMDKVKSKILFAAAAMAADAPPQWAYPANNPNYKPPVDDGRPVRVPDSTAGYTWSQLRDRFIAPIWHPGDHRPLPTRVEPLSPVARHPP